MARNPITNLFKAAFFEAVSNDPEWEQKISAWQNSRREFIRELSLAAGAMAVLTSFIPKNKKDAEIVIVGAGMAGLNAAYQLGKKGIRALVYEASSRSGGRMFTLRDQFGPGITTDMGGEFVDTTHTDILQLVKEFNLECYDLRKDKKGSKTFYFEGRHLDQADLRAAITPYAKQIMKDILSLPPVIDHTTADSFRHFDELAITEYLDSLGIRGWLFNFLNVVLTREYGMEAKDQSALNFMIMFVPPVEADKDYQLFGPTHEVFKIKGGSQHLTDTMYERLKEQVIFNHRLTGIHTTESGKTELIFKNKEEEKRVYADYVLLTIPFSILRNINCTVPMPSEKRKCIEEIGYGNSCKYVMGVHQKPWRQANQQGYTFTDLSFGAGWDSSQMQSEEMGSFTVFGGGEFGGYLEKSGESILSEKLQAELSVVYPSASPFFSDKNLKFCWASYPFTHGGYSAFKKGQWSTLSGWEPTPVGNIFFAGEHVSRECQGYMNGAAETARAAVDAMLTRMNAHIN